jgi:uncharacterized protein YecA (UPF0149 family)
MRTLSETNTSIQSIIRSNIKKHEMNIEKTLKRKPYKRGRALPERNDKCYCGSGRKYKHCHEPRHRQQLQEKIIQRNARINNN